MILCSNSVRSRRSGQRTQPTTPTIMIPPTSGTCPCAACSHRLPSAPITDARAAASVPDSGSRRGQRHSLRLRPQPQMVSGRLCVGKRGKRTPRAHQNGVGSKIRRPHLHPQRSSIHKKPRPPRRHNNRLPKQQEHSPKTQKRHRRFRGARSGYSTSSS
jgi:hypothetical protein